MNCYELASEDRCHPMLGYLALTFWAALAFTSGLLVLSGR
jgi:hypothetical protein